MADFDPCEWDSPDDNCADKVHIVTGERMSYDECFHKELACSPERVERAQLLRRMRSLERSIDVASRHLIAIGDAASFDPGQQVFAWQDLVDHVRARLNAAKEPR